VCDSPFGVKIDGMAARTRALSSLRLAGAAAAVCVLAACASGQAPAAPTTAPEQPPTAASPGAGSNTASAAPGAELDVEAQGTLAAPDQAQGAFTYNPQLAPVGAQVDAEIDGGADSTEISLDVTGMVPNRGYAAHVHAKPCGATGADAGPHYQNQVDPAATPEKASSDPTYANPQNEVWLDLRTDANGAGSSSADVPFTFTERRPGAVVIHEAEMTMTGPGMAGMAGGRVACLTIPAA
jgi:Cu-Zn family superoxide dismutase